MKHYSQIKLLEKKQKLTLLSPHPLLFFTKFNYNKFRIRMTLPKVPAETANPLSMYQTQGPMNR